MVALAGTAEAASVLLLLFELFAFAGLLRVTLVPALPGVAELALLGALLLATLTGSAELAGFARGSERKVVGLAPGTDLPSKTDSLPESST